LGEGGGGDATKMGRSILKFSAEVVPRCPFGPKTAEKWKTSKFRFPKKYCGARKSEGWKSPEKLGKKFAYHRWEKGVGETPRKWGVRY